METVLAECLVRVPVELLSYCVMPNHWHLVLRTTEPTELPRFMHWMTMTHAQRWHAVHETAGTGPVYQGRYKAVPVVSDEQLWRVCRYVERNPLSAGLVARAEDWRWSSLWHRCHNSHKLLLSRWQILLDERWPAFVNAGDGSPSEGLPSP